MKIIKSNNLGVHKYKILFEAITANYCVACIFRLFKICWLISSHKPSPTSSTLYPFTLFKTLSHTRNGLGTSQPCSRQKKLQWKLSELAPSVHFNFQWPQQQFPRSNSTNPCWIFFSSKDPIPISHQSTTTKQSSGFSLLRHQGFRLS